MNGVEIQKSMEKSIGFWPKQSQKKRIKEIKRSRKRIHEDEYIFELWTQASTLPMLFYPLCMFFCCFLLILFWSKVNGLFHRLLNFHPVHILLFNFLYDAWLVWLQLFLLCDSCNFNFDVVPFESRIAMQFVMGIGHWFLCELQSDLIFIDQTTYCLAGICPLVSICPPCHVLTIWVRQNKWILLWSDI